MSAGRGRQRQRVRQRAMDAAARRRHLWPHRAGAAPGAGVSLARFVCIVGFYGVHGWLTYTRVTLTYKHARTHKRTHVQKRTHTHTGVETHTQRDARTRVETHTKRDTQTQSLTALCVTLTLCQ